MCVDQYVSSVVLVYNVVGTQVMAHVHMGCKFWQFLS